MRQGREIPPRFERGEDSFSRGFHGNRIRIPRDAEVGRYVTFTIQIARWYLAFHKCSDDEEPLTSGPPVDGLKCSFFFLRARTLTPDPYTCVHDLELHSTLGAC